MSSSSRAGKTPPFISPGPPRARGLLRRLARIFSTCSTREYYMIWTMSRCYTPGPRQFLFRINIYKHTRTTTTVCCSPVMFQPYAISVMIIRRRRTVPMEIKRKKTGADVCRTRVADSRFSD